jgi:raffinose/stachyose/melibiose transport system substrate-binding protein
MGYPLVGEILKRPFNRDFVTLLTNEDANQNFDRYCAQAFVSDEMTLDKFIEAAQKMLENAKSK